MRLTCLGGAGEIGANSYVLECGARTLLLDSGLHPKKEGRAALPLLSAAPAEPDHILVTHAHLDHVGALPVVSRRFYRARIHMTPVTRRFALRMLRNTVNVLRRRAEESGVDAAGDPLVPALYDFDAVERLEDLIEEHELEEPFSLGAGVEAVFGSAGHIPGAAGLLIRSGGARGRSLFYTGDTCGRSQLLIPAARYPAQADVVLTESTYGGNPHADAVRLDEQLRGLGKLIARTTEAGGLTLIPVFALGRAQEILLAVNQLKKKGRLPRGLPVYLSGLARAFTQLYDQTRHQTPRRDADLQLMALEATALEGREVEQGGPPAPAVLIASSGMVLPHTLSNLLARRVLPDARSAIALVGYNDPESPGASIQKSQLGDLINLGDHQAPVARRCAVERFYFSAHSTRGELLQMLRGMSPQKVVLVHGDSASGQALGALHLQEERPAQTLYPEPGQPLEL